MSDMFPPTTDPARSYAPPPTEGPRGKGIASLVLGLCSMLMWLCPLIGIPVCIVGLVLGILARRERQGSIATAGILLSSIGLLASLINAGVGAYLAVTGQHPLVEGLQNN